jgi:RNA polymerase sigma-70 factor (ECF subfamily)
MASVGKGEGGRTAPATVDEAWRLGSAQWPGLRPSRARFEAQWQACAKAGASPVFVEDLFLAHACLAGDPAALQIFDATYVTHVRSYVARFEFTPGDLAEVSQLLRVRLLTGPEPKLMQFAGAGPLARWIRVAAVRVAVNFLASRHGKAAAADVAPEEALLLATADLPAAEQDVVNLLMTAKHRTVVREILGEALAALPDHEKTVLRMYLLDGVAVESIARVFSVHRATVARWLNGIRRRVLDAVNDRLSLRLGASGSQVRSLFRVFRFDLDLSMKRLLGAAPANLSDAGDTPDPSAAGHKQRIRAT